MSARKAGLWMLAAGALPFGACAHQHDNGPSGAGESNGGSADAAVPVNPQAHVGAKASLTLEPVAGPGGEPGDGPDGDGTFSQTSLGIDLTLTLRNCAVGQSYPLFILAGSDCSDEVLHGQRWDGARGAGMPPIQCSPLAGGMGRLTYTRSKSDAKPWTIGKPDASNLLGHALIAVDPDTMQPVSCGTIDRAPDVEAVPEQVREVAPEVSAVLAGICLAKSFVLEAREACPDPVELTRCASLHCELDPCIHKCSDYLACIAKTEDRCQGEWDCALSDACYECRPAVSQCTFTFCAEQLACAPPVAPDGPCRQLEACCALQGDGAASCLDSVRLVEKLSGDSSCVGVMNDWDSFAHLRVPCRFE